MAWFDEHYHFNRLSLRVAHITDSHLFAEPNAEYFNVNTAAHFAQVLAHMATQSLDAVIFGGDLTQDHSFESYLLFAELINNADLTCPVFWVPGNHDEIAMLNRISGGQIVSAKRIIAQGFELLLINSKGPTPAGWVSSEHLNEIADCLASSQSQHVVFCHHNPLAINGYLDKHMLENGPQLLNVLVNSANVAALLHGHVHNHYTQTFRELSIYATPASSVQFTKNCPQWQQENHGPAYRMLHLTTQDNALTVKTDVVWLNA